MHVLTERKYIGKLALALLLGICVAPLAAQHEPVYARSHALDESESQAEQQADQIVSLSAEKLITLLQKETGLLLEVKKSLVRKAFEQGRILEPRDLTDEALFRLLREDENVRILATQEVVDRYYIRALPTREERERQAMVTRNAEEAKELAAARQQTEGQLSNGMQEDLYWSQQQQRKGSTPPPIQVPPSQQSPEAPLIPPGRDMTPIQPDELPALLRASAAMGGGAGATAIPNFPAATMGNTVPSVPPAALASGLPDLGDIELPQHENQDLQQRADVRPEPVTRPREPLRTPDRIALQHRVNPYADVPSLYDLYSQYGQRSPELKRFGDDIFRNGTGNFEQLPMDLPVGPDYVLGPGDGVNIDMWGGVSQRLRRVVDREGRIALPEAGSVQVSGRTLGDVQRLVQVALQSQFRYEQADVSLSRLRTIRVYVVGDVERAGAYDISSLSTPLNAVFAAGGPTSRGSLRTLRHFRGNQLIQEVDVYDLLLKGVRSGVERMQAGDTVLVPPLGPEVTVEGMVRRPAIYELHGEKSLAQVLELAGGVLTTGTLRHIDVERVQAHESRTMLRLDVPETNNQELVTKTLEEFVIQDGDKIKISPVLPYTDKTVYLEGHVFRPGKYAFRDGMVLTDLIGSYKDLLPEPSKQHAEIVRLGPPDYKPEVLAFNLGEALQQKAQPIALKPFDTVRIFSRFDFEDPPVVTVSGAVRDPGDHVTNGVTRIRDAVYLAGGLTPEASTDWVQIFRKSGNDKLTVLSVNLGRALQGDEKDNLLLVPKDRLIIHRNLSKADPPTATIEGEVEHPGRYPLGTDMTAAQLVRLAGGFKRGAYTETADLTSYSVEHGEGMIGEHSTVQIARALAGEEDTDMRLHDGDVLTIRQLAGWKDVGASVTVGGEVMHPGTYGIEEGERLSSVLRRAGGLRSDAYAYGAIFERATVREIAEENHLDLLTRVEKEGAALKAIPETDAEQRGAKSAALMQWQSTVDRVQNTHPAGRMVIHISKDPGRWMNTSADIPLRAGDSIFIPKVPTSIMVDGAVYNATAITYKPGKSARWYLRQAGGPTNVANRKSIFVIRADGSVIGGSGGMFSGGVESAELRPGDMLVVPEKSFSAATHWKTLLESSQLVYAAGIAIQVARSF